MGRINPNYAQRSKIKTRDNILEIAQREADESRQVTAIYFDVLLSTWKWILYVNTQQRTYMYLHSRPGSVTTVMPQRLRGRR